MMIKNKLRISDLVIMIAILLVLIPQVRREISAFMIKLTMKKANTKEVPPGVSVSTIDQNWEIIDLYGESYFLKEFENEVIFLNLWATWCPPCRAEMPSVQNLYNLYKDKVKFILVTNEDPETVAKYLNNKNYMLPVYRTVTKPPEVFKANNIPATFLISRKGEIILKHIGAAKWDNQQIMTLLTEEINK